MGGCEIYFETHG